MKVISKSIAGLILIFIGVFILLTIIFLPNFQETQIYKTEKINTRLVIARELNEGQIYTFSYKVDEGVVNFYFYATESLIEKQMSTNNNTFQWNIRKTDIYVICIENVGRSEKTIHYYEKIEEPSPDIISQYQIDSMIFGGVFIFGTLYLVKKLTSTGREIKKSTENIQQNKEITEMNLTMDVRVQRDNFVEYKSYRYYMRKNL